MNQTKETLLMDIAQLLASQASYEDIVIQSLQLICCTFPFDNGLIYELDERNTYELVKPCSIHPTNVPSTFDFGKEGFDIFSNQDNPNLLCIQKEDNCNKNELLLLHTFSASGLFSYSALDESSHILGLIVFLRKPNAYLSDEDQVILTVILSLVGHYVESQMLKNMHKIYHDSLNNILDNIGIDIYANDFYTHEILYVNKSMALPYGGVEAFKGKKCWEVLFPGQNGPCEFCPETELLDENGMPTRIYSWNYQRAFDGAWFRVFSVAFRWMDGRLAHMVSSANITENKKNEEMIEYMANYDLLTGLPNRRKLLRSCEEKIKHAACNDEIFYVLFFDIDGFKAINDCYGHDAGDEFLIQLAKFYFTLPLLNDSIYRNGGDEFVALIGSKNIREEDVTNLMDSIHARFNEPWILKKGIVTCQVSIGIACYPDDGLLPESLLQKADQAMYHTKRLGGASFCFGYQLSKP